MARMKPNYVTTATTPSQSVMDPVLHTLPAFSLVFPATTPWRGKYYFTHFTDEGAETKTSNFLKNSTAGKEQSKV